MLIDRFALELVVTFLLSLRFAHADEAALSTAEHTSLALRNLQRIVIKRAPLLRQPQDPKKRRVPPGWESIDLGRLVKWAFGQIGRTETEVSVIARHREGEACVED